MRFFKCIECGQEGHLKCTKEAESVKIKIDAKVINDLNEFIVEKFREAEHEDSENGGNPEVDAFDYVQTSKDSNKKKKKSNKLTKSQKRLR